MNFTMFGKYLRDVLLKFIVGTLRHTIKTMNSKVGKTAVGVRLNEARREQMGGKIQGKWEPELKSQGDSLPHSTELPLRSAALYEPAFPVEDQQELRYLTSFHSSSK